jgi:acyl-CoA thioesterase
MDVMDTEPPAVPRPDACPNIAEVGLGPGRIRAPFFRNLDVRLAAGQPWWESDWSPGPARVARWFRYKLPQRLGDGRLDPLAIPPIADTMPPALIQKLGPNRPLFHAPSLDLTVHFLEDTTSQWLLTAVHARRARAGYASAAAEIWDDGGRLIAFATQTMLLRQGSGTPVVQE